MRIIWEEEALTEANAAVRYYHQQQAGLGQRFVDAIEDATAKIAQRPLLYRKRCSQMQTTSLPFRHCL